MLHVPSALPDTFLVPTPSERKQEAPRLDPYPPAYLCWGWGAGAGHITYAGVREMVKIQISFKSSWSTDLNPY
jgi:hypothetical protein